MMPVGIKRPRLALKRVRIAELNAQERKLIEAFRRSKESDRIFLFKMACYYDDQAGSKAPQLKLITGGAR